MKIIDVLIARINYMYVEKVLRNPLQPRSFRQTYTRWSVEHKRLKNTVLEKKF